MLTPPFFELLFNSEAKKATADYKQNIKNMTREAVNSPKSNIAYPAKVIIATSKFSFNMARLAFKKPPFIV